MSFDLAFWHEVHPSSPAAARRLYERLVDEESNVVEDSVEIRRLYEDILTAYGDMGDDAAPWTSPIYRTDACMMVAISWSVYRDVSQALITMANDRGVTVYDPQAGTVHKPARTALEQAGSPAHHYGTLAPYNGPEIANPSNGDIDFTVRRLSDREWFASLEKGPDEYIQVGYGEQAQTRPGWYVIERREGSAERHFRTETSDVNAVVRAFTDYLRGDDSWKRRFGWRRWAM